MKFSLLTVMVLCSCLPGISAASNAVQPGNGPAQSLNQPPAPAQPPDTPPVPPDTPVSRGQLLYENHCLKCHESGVHIRAQRKAKNLADVQVWVTKWQAHEKLDWGRGEINDVSSYLIEHFYQFK